MHRYAIGLFLGLWPVAVGAASPDAPSGAAKNPLAAWPLDYWSATRDRPLFSPTRRPPPPPPPPIVQRVEPPLLAPPPSIALLGVVTDEIGARAVVRSGGAAKVFSARVGEEIEGWKVTEIEPRRLVLSHDDRSLSFALFANQKGKEAVVQQLPAVHAPTLAERREARRKH